MFEKELAEWEESLTEEEEHAIFEWVHDGSDGIRDLQMGKGLNSSMNWEQLAELSDTMEGAFDRGPKFRGTAYRGLSNLEPKVAAKIAIRGNVIAMDASTSATVDRSVAQAFGSDIKQKEETTWIEYKIRTRSSFKLSDMFNRAPGDEEGGLGEQEVVLPRGSRYRIIRVSERTGRFGTKGFDVEMEEIGP